MNKSSYLLLGLVGCITKLSNAVEISASSAFAHYDTDKNSVLSKDEFSVIVLEVERPVETFRLMDINHNEQVEYDEAVYVHKELIKANPGVVFDGDLTKEGILDWQAVESDFNQLATGHEFNDETEAEYLVNALFAAIDTAGNNYITELQYAEYFIQQEWEQALSLIGGKSEINEADFTQYFSQSKVYKIFQAISEVSQADSGIINTLMDKIEEAHSNPDTTLQEMDEELVFEVHQFDESLSQRRRLNAAWLTGQIVVMMMNGMGHSGTSMWSKRTGNCCESRNYEKTCFEFSACSGCICWERWSPDIPNQACYDDYNTVDVLGRGTVYIKDVSIGDYVYDGDDYTKVYFIQKYPENILVNMLEIKYGNPDHDNSIILTPQHLLYNLNYEDGDKPVTSGDISIGDTLIGANNMRGDNFTVYDIKVLRDRHPINPITSSGKLLVNGVKTSVFSHSASEANRLHEAAAIFRWISDNVHEELAASIINFYYNIIYSRVIRQNNYIHQLIIQSQSFATLVILSVPLILIGVVFKTSKKQI